VRYSDHGISHRLQCRQAVHVEKYVMIVFLAGLLLADILGLEAGWIEYGNALQAE
jgi:hypothetical protein